MESEEKTPEKVVEALKVIDAWLTEKGDVHGGGVILALDKSILDPSLEPFINISVGLSASTALMAACAFSCNEEILRNLGGSQ